MLFSPLPVLHLEIDQTFVGSTRGMLFVPVFVYDSTYEVLLVLQSLLVFLQFRFEVLFGLGFVQSHLPKLLFQAKLDVVWEEGVLLLQAHGPRWL